MRAKPPKMPSPTSIMLEMAKVDQIKEILGETRDAESILASIESETDALEKLDVIVECVMSDKDRSDKASRRAKRLKERAAFGRFVVMQIMEKFGTSKIERAEYTASIGAGVPSVVISDDTIIPRRFLSPDKDAIQAALKQGENVPGATLNNAPPVLRIRET
jgi:Siphovirus Gp157